MINLRKSWQRICDRAGLADVRLHDLRHTAASIAVGQGASLPIIGRLLGIAKRKLRSGMRTWTQIQRSAHPTHLGLLWPSNWLAGAWQWHPIRLSDFYDLAGQSERWVS